MSKRKQVEQLILSTLDKIDVGSSKDNTTYYRELFAKMTDKQFDDFMVKLRDKKITLSMIIPNGGAVKVDVENNFKIAREFGYEFIDHLKFVDVPNYGTYITPVKYLTMMLPIRRAAQTLSKKISIPESDNKIDMLSGQVTGKSKSSKLTLPEIQILAGMGLKDSIRELVKLRGGDLGGKRAMNTYLIKTGEVSQSDVEPYTTGVKSVQVLKSYFKAIHIASTL